MSHNHCAEVLAVGEHLPLRPQRGIRGWRCGIRLRLYRRRSLGNRRKRRHHPLRREGDDHFGADPQLGFQREGAAVQIDQILGDRQAETGALFGGFDRVLALSE
jgi:hypothetical protein